MNAYIHSEISVKNRGGKIEDYLPIHDFIDSTKELCSDNRHRILHTIWGIRRVIVPIFGHYFHNSDGKIVNVKDLCEQDHILPDYRYRFIPTLNDFVEAISPDDSDLSLVSEVFEKYKSDKEVCELLLSPLNNTGRIESLLITHNSWFLNEILPKLFTKDLNIDKFKLSPSDFFNRMRFERWMDNGLDYPTSAKQFVLNNINL
ncbi:MAG: hypothetical protein U0Y10_26340 [Spirosomataceae bacterium]